MEQSREKIIKAKCEKMTKSASQWQLKKYDLWNSLPKSMFINSFIILSIAVFSLCTKINPIGTSGIIVGVMILLLFPFIEICICCNHKLKYSIGIHLFLPRLLGAIIGAWLMISFASNVFPQFYAITFDNCELAVKNGFIAFILFLLTCIFVYDGIGKKVPYLIKCSQKMKRTGLLMLISFCYSYIIGIFATALVGTEAIKSTKKLNDFIPYIIDFKFGNSTIYISPGFVFVFSFVAMFIGLFIERIFDDKQVVDSE
jgi:hypothetical protein